MIAYGALSWYRQSKKGTNSVPCGDCSACCSQLHAPIDPTVDRGSYTVTRNDDGSFELARQANGYCIYLSDGHCEIYEHRPLVCRTFDCRALLAADIHEPLHVWDAATKKFQIIAKEPGDAAFLAGLRSTAATLIAQGVSAPQALAQVFS